MNYKIEKEINDTIISETNDKTFNNYIENYTANKKKFYNIIKDAIYSKYGDRANTFSRISKMLYLEILDNVFKHGNEHQQKIFIFNSDYIDKQNFNNQLEAYNNKVIQRSENEEHIKP